MRPSLGRLLPAVALVFAGCATLRALRFDEPQVALERIEITGIGLTGGTFDLQLDVYNPNPYELRSTKIELGLDLEGTHFGDALVDKPLALSSENHTRVVVPVRFEWAAVGAAARALIDRQSVRYRLTGAVLADTPIGERRIGVSRDGTVPLSRISP